MGVTRKVLGSDYGDTLLQVRKACAYIPSDHKIAQFFAVTVDLVKGERAKLPKRNIKSLNWSGSSDATHYSNDSAVRDSVAHATNKLNALCWQLYEREGEKRGIPPLEVAVHMGMHA